MDVNEASDRASNAFSGKIAPDAPIHIDRPTFGTTEDPVYRAARARLMTQEGYAA